METNSCAAALQNHFFVSLIKITKLLTFNAVVSVWQKNALFFITLIKAILNKRLYFVIDTMEVTYIAWWSSVLNEALRLQIRLIVDEWQLSLKHFPGGSIYFTWHLQAVYIQALQFSPKGVVMSGMIRISLFPQGKCVSLIVERLMSRRYKVQTHVMAVWWKH